MRVVIAGASGLIGTAVAEALRVRGDQAIALVRRAANGPGEISWDPAEGRLDPSAIADANAILNLSGASIGRLPWTARYKNEILRSRLAATSTLVRAMAALDAPPSSFVSASAVGYYGSRPGVRLTETSSKGDGFLSDVTARWEAAAHRAPDGVRVAIARSGIVVATGGVLTPLLRLTKAGLGGPLGSGEQHWPWVSLGDEVRGILHLLDSELSGPVNLTGPVPSTAGELGRHLAKRMNRPYWLPAPAFAIRVALGDAANDLLLIDQNIEPAALEADGFVFEQRTVEQAIDVALRAG